MLVFVITSSSNVKKTNGLISVCTDALGSASISSTSELPAKPFTLLKQKKRNSLKAGKKMKRTTEKKEWKLARKTP